MTATTAPITATSTATTQSRTPRLWQSGAAAGIVAALATSVIAAGAMGVDVPVEIDGEQIPAAGFAQLTLMCTAVGVLLAKACARWASQPRRTFTRLTVALTALSIVPDLTVNATTATRAVLIATHLVAAAVVIPTIARRLASHDS